MYFDIGVAGTILTLAIWGLFAGFWGQVLRLIALASLYFVAPPVAREFVEEPVRGQLGADVSATTVNGVALIAAAVGLYLLMSLIIFIGMKIAGAGKKMSATNKLGGFLLGGLKGGALVYLLLCGLVLVAASDDYGNYMPGAWEEQARASKVVELVANNNLLDLMGYELPSADELREIAGELGAGEELEQVMPGQVPGQVPAQVPSMPGVPSGQVPTMPGQVPAQMPTAPVAIPSWLPTAPQAPAVPATPRPGAVSNSPF
jgi:uncharacterized membrane protein required for colicin V production